MACHYLKTARPVVQSVTNMAFEDGLFSCYCPFPRELLVDELSTPCAGDC
jgi:hypothetical protein